MSVPLNVTAGGTVLPEYAATNSTTMRILQKIGGEYVPVFTGNINYSLTRYLLNSEGKKVAILQPEPYQPEPGKGYDDLNNGSFAITAEELAADLADDPTLAAAFETIATYEDGKMRAHLITRKII